MKTAIALLSVVTAFVAAAPFASADNEVESSSTADAQVVEAEQTVSAVRPAQDIEGDIKAIDDAGNAGQDTDKAGQDTAAPEAEETDADALQEAAREVQAPAAVNTTSVGSRSASQKSSNAINTNDKEVVRKAFIERYAKNDIQTLASTGADTRRCIAGEINPQTADMVISTWNFFRSLNGLDAVSVDPASPLSKYIQKAALTQAAQNEYGTGRKGLSHYPKPSGFKCADNEANAGSSHSNLAQANGFTPAEQIQWWYQDWSGAGASTMTREAFNDKLGHRAWLMDPFVTESAYGNVNGYNALAVATGGNYDDYDGSRLKNPNATTPETMSWPAAGYFPSELLTSISGTNLDSNDVERWSFRVRGADMSNVKVSVTGPKGAIATRVVKGKMKYAPGSTSGYGTVLFKMSNKDVHAPKGTGVNTYTVRVSGVKNASKSSYYYQVKVFNANITNSRVKPQLIVARQPIALQGTTAVPARVRAIGNNVKFQWQRSADQGRTWSNVPVDKAMLTTSLLGQPNELSWSPNARVCDKILSGHRQSCPLSYNEAKKYRFRLRATNAAGTTYTPALQAAYVGFKPMATSVKKGGTVKAEFAFEGNGDWVTTSGNINWYGGRRVIARNTTTFSTAGVSYSQVEARTTVRVWTRDAASMKFVAKSPTVTIR